MLLVLAGVGVSGYFLSGISQASSADTRAFIIERTTTLKTIAVRRNGKTITRTVPIVRVVKLPAQTTTVRSTQRVTTPGGVKTINSSKVKYVAVTKTRVRTVDQLVTTVVTRNGKTTTVTRTRPVTVKDTVPVTVSQTTTHERTITSQSTLTTTTTLPAKTTTLVVTTTQTVTRKGGEETVTVTVTGPTQTVTVLVTTTVTHRTTTA